MEPTFREENKVFQTLENQDIEIPNSEIRKKRKEQAEIELEEILTRRIKKEASIAGNARDATSEWWDSDC